MSPHDSSEVPHADTMAVNISGTGFAGPSTNTLFYNLTLALATAVGGFMVAIPVLALAGSLVGRDFLKRV